MYHVYFETPTIIIILLYKMDWFVHLPHLLSGVLQNKKHII